MQNRILFLYPTNHWILECLKSTLYDSPQTVKYLGVSFAKHVQDPYSED